MQNKNWPKKESNTLLSARPYKVSDVGVVGGGVVGGQTLVCFGKDGRSM